MKSPFAPLNKLAIVGGGPGGLMTAYLLQKAWDRPIHVTIFEASSRLGGKIMTCSFPEVGEPYEAGAAEIYDYSTVDECPLKELINELGLSTTSMGGSSVIQDQRIISNLDDLEQQLGAAARLSLETFDRRSRDAMSPWEFYQSDEPGLIPPTAAQSSRNDRFDALLDNGITHPATRRYVDHLIHSDLATESACTTPTYGLQNYLMNHPAYMRLYSIVGGNEQLPRALAARIHANICLEHHVVRIEATDEQRYRVTTNSPTGQRDEQFDAVVVALPNRCLPQIQFGPSHLQEALQRHYEYYDHPAHYLRVTLLFERPFWRGHLQDSYWMLDQFDGCCLYDESSRIPGSIHGILGWLLGGQSAVEMNAYSDEEIIARALDSLPDFLSAGHEQLLAGRVHRWIDAVSAMPGGIRSRPVAERHQPAPHSDPRLFLVGDYLFDSTLNGVLDSAQYVADWLIQSISGSQGRGT